MDRTDDRLARRVAVAVRGDDPRGTAVGDDDLAHVLADEYGAAAIFNATGECLRELAAAANRDAKPVRFQEAKEYEHAQARRLFIRGHQVFPRHPGKMRAHPIVFEVFREHIVTAHLHGAPELPALAALIEERETRALRRGRRIE